jgi:hypothetical protein
VPLPDPVPGPVLHYSYLWHDQHRRGMEEGVKDRPCVVVLAVEEEGCDTIVTVAPITHTPPRLPFEAVELPPTTKRRLGLDDRGSWVVTTELNRFPWPGPDLRPLPGFTDHRYAYGVLPPGLFRQVKEAIAARAATQRLRLTPR